MPLKRRKIDVRLSKPKKSLKKRIVKGAGIALVAGSVGVGVVKGVKGTKRFFSDKAKHKIERVERINAVSVAELQKIYPWFSPADSVGFRAFLKKVNSQLPKENQASFLGVLRALEDEGYGSSKAWSVGNSVQRFESLLSRELRKPFPDKKLVKNYKDNISRRQRLSVVLSTAAQDNYIKSVYSKMLKTKGSLRKLDSIAKKN